jgi:hypothetical protein
MIDPQKMSYGFATDVSKQLITLASAMLTFGAAFAHNIQPRGLWSGLIVASYIALFASIIFGIRALFVITRVLAEVQSDEASATPIVTRIPGVKRSLALQWSFFATAAVFLGVFGFSTICV